MENDFKGERLTAPQAFDLVVLNDERIGDLLIVDAALGAEDEIIPKRSNQIIGEEVKGKRLIIDGLLGHIGAKHEQAVGVDGD